MAYYDAHEYFEEIWTDHELEDRIFIQALIQLSVAYFHITNSNKNGAMGLFKKSIKKLDLYIDTIQIISNINDIIKAAHDSYEYIQQIDDTKALQPYFLQLFAFDKVGFQLLRQISF